MLGSSGGAVTALALAQAHPGLVHTVVAHEPPLEELLDDRDALRAHAAAMVERYRAGDALGAWQLFPGGHTGFAEDPDAFVPRLRKVLAG